MKKLLFILTLLPGLAIAQEHFIYVDASFDPNKALGLVDNPRTAVDHRGLDFDAEVGVKYKRVGVFLHYGRFENAGYQQYGAGAEYYLATGDWYDITLGAELGAVLRRYEWEGWDKPVWGGAVAGTLRNTFTFWALPNVGITARQQMQGRPDIDQLFVYEVSLGIRIKFNRKY